MTLASSSKISTLALILLITGAIDNIRNLPTTALFGSQLIFFFIFSAVVFLIPVALISAELASSYPEEEGGVYSWVERAFGKSTAFFTIWLQWVNTIIWYPSILLFISSTLAYLINPELSNNKLYAVSVVLVTFWGLTLLGLSGLRISARFAGVCAFLGMILPMVLIIFMGSLWVVQQRPVAIDLSWGALLPNFNTPQIWSSLTAIMTSFLGMELAAVHVRQIKNPQKNFPKAMLCSVVLILMTMIFGSLAIAFVLPTNQISLVSGVLQAFQSFLNAYHLSEWMIIVVIMILIGSIGNMINWIISPAKGLALAAEHGFLPHWFYRTNAQGMPSRILLAQAMIVTFLCTGILLFPSMNGIYWFFTDLSTEIYIGMYILLFLAAFKLKNHTQKHPEAFTIPGGPLVYYITCGLGLIGCLITLFVGFFPPVQSIDVGGASHFRLVFFAGILITMLPAIGLILRHKLIAHGTHR